MASFSEAFKAARKKLGAGKTFTWNGKKYTTDLASEKSTTVPVKRPTSTSSSPKPMKRPVKEAESKTPVPTPTTYSPPKSPKQEYRDEKTLRRKQDKSGPVQGPMQTKTVTGPNTAPVSLVNNPYAKPKEKTGGWDKKAFRAAKAERRKQK